MRASEGGLVAVLRNQAFLRLWVIQGLSQTAQNMINFTLLIVVRTIVETQQLTQANTAVSLLVLAFSVPAVIFSPIAGVVVDRANKRTVMLISNALRVLGVLAFLGLDPAWPAQITLVALYSITFFLGAVGMFFGPAQLATIPNIVSPRDLINANALFNLTVTGSQILGFAVFGPLTIKLVGTEMTLIGILILYVFTTGMVLLLPRSSGAPRLRDVMSDDGQPFRQFIREAREGVVLILQRAVLLKAITYLTLATTTYLMIAALGPEFITNVLGLSREDIGFIVAPAGLGVVAGALVVNKVTRKIPAPRLVDYGLIGAAASLALLALTEPVARIFDLSQDTAALGVVLVAVFFSFTLGISNAFIIVPAQTLLQLGSPENALARVYATFFTVSNIAMFIPVLFAGAFADLYGVIQVFLAVAVLLLATGLYNLRQPAPVLEERDTPLSTPGPPPI
ncbi:MFS transporter [soil metagenome]